MSIVKIISMMSGSGGTTPIPLFVFNGESNSGGYAVNADCTSDELQPRPMLQILNNANFTFENMQIGVNNLIDHAGLMPNATHGWENGLANEIEAGNVGHSVAYLVKTGQGGTTISQWASGGEYMDTFILRYNTAADLLSTAGITYFPIVFYSQGINDAIAGTDVATWKAATVQHFSDIRSLLGPSTYILMTLLMTPGQTGTYGNFNTAMTEIASEDPFSFTISTTGATLRDGNHWDYGGMKLIASRMVEKMNELI